MSENAKNPLAAFIARVAKGAAAPAKPVAARPGTIRLTTGRLGAGPRPPPKPCVCPQSALPRVRKG